MKTIKDYTLGYLNYGEITVPKGTELTHMTASGFDSNYHFVNETDWVDKNYPEISNILRHDLEFHGINVPKKYVDKYYDFKIDEEYDEKTIQNYSEKMCLGWCYQIESSSINYKKKIGKTWITLYRKDNHANYKFRFVGYEEGMNVYVLEEIQVDNVLPRNIN